MQKVRLSIICAHMPLFFLIYILKIHFAGREEWFSLYSAKRDKAQYYQSAFIH